MLDGELGLDGFVVVVVGGWRVLQDVFFFGVGGLMDDVEEEVVVVGAFADDQSGGFGIL